MQKLTNLNVRLKNKSLVYIELVYLIFWPARLLKTVVISPKITMLAMLYESQTTLEDND